MDRGPTLPTLIVGYGNMGTKHARALRELGGELWGAVDPKAERRRHASAENPECKTFADVGEALRECPGGVCGIVAASTQMHFDIARQLLEKQIPTLVEKPLSASSEQARTLTELARSRATLLTAGHVERFNPAVVAAKKMVADGVLGDILQICFRRVGGTPSDAAGLGDVLSDLAVHDYDLARFITSSDLEITQALGHQHDGRLDGALVLGKLASGGSAHFQVNWRTPVKVRRLELTGSTRYAEINLITQQVVVYQENPLLQNRSIEPEAHAQYQNYLLSFSSPERMEVGVVRVEPLKEELQAFWRAIAGGTAAPVSPEDALRAVELTERTRLLLGQS